MFDSVKHIHFVGIGGTGMNGIAEVLLNLGYAVSGSDMKESPVTERLRKLGAHIYIGHSRGNIGNPDVVVTSTAIMKTNEEVLAANEKNIPVIPRAEMLAELMRLKYAVLVAGTHGKTTTTSILSWIMSKAKFDPTIVIGGRLNNIGSNAKLGQGKFIVAEADESDGSFLMLTPMVSIVTNIDNDHMDHYKTMDNLLNSFLQFMNKVPFYGWTVVCNDDDRIHKLLPKLKRKYFTYGIKRDSDMMAKDVKVSDGNTVFNVFHRGKMLGEVRSPLAGRHNVLNVLAAILVAIELGIDFVCIKDALKDFKGVGRRLEYKGEKKNILVVDDYGHHPREIAAVWDSVVSFWPDRKKYVVFQPHRYSRTQILAKEFAEVLAKMENVILTPIYPAGEKPIKDVSSELIKKYIPKAKQSSIICLPFDEIVDYLENIDENSVILTLGAGNVYQLGEEFLNRK